MTDKLKQPIIYLIWNLYMWGVIFFEEIIVNYVQNQIKTTTQIELAYLGMLTQVSVWILVGLGIGWLISEKSILSAKDMVLEICIILVMNILLVLLTSPFGSVLPIHLPFISFMGNMRYVGGLVIGMEIFRITKYIKNRKNIK